MEKRKTQRRVLSIIGVIAVMLFTAWAEGHMDGFQVRLIHMWGIYAILVSSFNLIYGFTGQFSLAHAGLAAVGAYTVALLTLSPEAKQVSFMLAPPVWPISVVHWPFVPSLVLGGLIAAAVGFVIGAPALRLHGDYLLITTFGFSEIIRLLLCNVPGICNGAMGLKGIPKNTNLTWVWGLAIIALFVTKRLVDSSYGRALRCIRDDEIAAEAVGVNLSLHKIMAFVFSSFFVGIAGGLMSNLLGTVAPSTFKPDLTYAVITMAVLGGVQSLTGGVIAAGLYAIASELLRTIESPRQIFGINYPGMPGLRALTFAVLLLLLILFYRRGLMGAREFSWGAVISRVQRLLGKARSGGQEA
jgi:branched-chain amino acid transport system permease protein